MIGQDGFDSKIIPLVWYALVQGYKLKDRIEPPFSREDVESMDLDVLMVFIGVLTKSIEKMGDSEKKKLAAEANKKTVSLKAKTMD